MSLDVFVACATAVVLPSHLPADIEWRLWDTGSFTAEKPPADWVVEVWIVKDPKQIEQMNLPAGKTWVVGISLGGNHDDGVALLERTYETVVKNCDGVLLDY